MKVCDLLQSTLVQIYLLNPNKSHILTSPYFPTSPRKSHPASTPNTPTPQISKLPLPQSSPVATQTQHPSPSLVLLRASLQVGRALRHQSLLPSFHILTRTVYVRILSVINAPSSNGKRFHSMQNSLIPRFQTISPCQKVRTLLRTRRGKGKER